MTYRLKSASLQYTWYIIGCTDACNRQTGNPSALRDSMPVCRREVDCFSFFFRHRSRLLRQYPGRACTSASSSARATGIVAEECASKRRLAHLSVRKHETHSFPKAVRPIAASNFAANPCFDQFCALNMFSSTRSERVHSLFRTACPLASTIHGNVCPTIYPMNRAGGVGA